MLWQVLEKWCLRCLRLPDSFNYKGKYAVLYISLRTSNSFRSSLYNLQYLFLISSASLNYYIYPLSTRYIQQTEATVFERKCSRCLGLLDSF